MTVKKDDKLIDRLISMGALEGGNKDLATFELPAMADFNNEWMKGFLIMLFAILERKIVLE